ncbi:hypothetical protein [Mesorhizobium sp. SARCC-RB16n]|uniref:hypothetical protein n=1 Tax=Mesorhizobium sp. SARCC-RB16n TaxID=2116687 RepID=UPI0016681DEB|nr:hypothetical protein [Mesorhizobium sp. SARCC-RB16n]
MTGAYAKMRFENEGNPATQALVKYTPLPNGAGEDFTRSFYDGLGRSIGWKLPERRRPDQGALPTPTTIRARG